MKGIMKNVAISDLVTVNVYKAPPAFGDPNPYQVNIDPFDLSKRVVIDESALKTLNLKLTEKLKGTDTRNPNFIEYIKDFTLRMADELYKNGLLVIEDLPDSPEDPYEAAKKSIARK